MKLNILWLKPFLQHNFSHLAEFNQVMELSAEKFFKVETGWAAVFTGN